MGPPRIGPYKNVEVFDWTLQLMCVSPTYYHRRRHGRLIEVEHLPKHHLNTTKQNHNEVNGICVCYHRCGDDQPGMCLDFNKDLVSSSSLFSSYDDHS